MRAINGSSTGLALAPRERDELVKWSRSRTRAARVVLRSRIVLLLADGAAVKSVAGTLGIAPATVRLWMRRFREGGAEALLKDAAGRGRKPALSPAVREEFTSQTKGAARLTVREHARELGVSPSTVSRWRRRAT